MTTTPVRPVLPDLIDPIAEYDHDEGLAVVGGWIYGGNQFPPLNGRCVFADWGSYSTPSGRLFYLDAENVIREFRLGRDDRSIGLWLKDMGQDADGELYVLAARSLGPAGNTGRMFKIVPPPDPIELALVPGSAPALTTAWTGGQGPFAVQKKDALNEPVWSTVEFTEESHGTVPHDTASGFLRVADTAHLPAIPLAVFLSSELVVPEPTATGATGSGILSLEGNTLSFDVRYAGLSGPATAAHLQGPASAAQAADAFLDLTPFHVGAFGLSGSLAGIVSLSDTNLASLVDGTTYLDLHTANHPGDEIRGQISR